MNHDAISVEICRIAGLSTEDTKTLLTRLAGAQGATSDGSTASYYELPEGATELQHLIGHRNMNAQIGEIFRACYRYGIVAHSPQVRDIKKIIFYAKAELERLEKLNG
ncbi:hypothetical protein H0A64_09795 [Alcaligenaceae bacterium]|nr:hypothetical protein [Alcaligenaceae bacterium]